MKKLIAVIAAQVLFVGIVLQIAATNFFSAPPIYVETFDPPNTVPGTTDETSALASAEAAAAAVGGRVQLNLRSYYLAGGTTVPSLVNVSGNAYSNFSSAGGIDGVALNAPQLILASGTQETISAASYNSTTGLVTLTLAATPSGLAVGTAINVYGVMGTGDYLAANGQYAAAAGTTGNTVTYTIPTNLTLTLASAGTLDYGAATINVNGTLRNVTVVRQGTNLNATTLSACLANEANMNGRGIVVGTAAVIEHVMLFGHAVGIYTNNAASWHIDDVRSDNLSGVNITGMHQYSSINNVHNEPILAYGCGGNPIFAITGVADNGSGIMRVTTSTPHDLIANQRVIIAGVQGALSANWAWVVTPIDATHFDLTKRADDGSPGLLAPTVTATLTAGSVTIPLSSMDGIADGQTISGSGITGTPAIVNQSVPLSQIAIASGGSVTGTGAATLTINNGAYVANTGTLYVSSDYRPGPCLYVQNSESPMGAVYTCHGYGNLVTLDSQAGWLKIAGLSLEADVYGSYDPTSVAITLRGNSSSGSPYGTSFDVGYFNSWTALKVNSGSSKTQHFNGGEMYAFASSSYGPPGIEILSGHVELNGLACGGDANSFFVSASATLNLNGLMCENSYWAYGSAFSNAVVTGSTFSDFAGNVVRGPTVSLAVPNAAGTGFQQPLIASVNGVQFATPPLTVGTLPTCNTTEKNFVTSVSDANNPINGSAVAGGGSTLTQVWCNGSNWLVTVGGGGGDGVNAASYLVCDGTTDNAMNLANWQAAIAASPGKAGYIPPQSAACMTSANLTVVSGETITAVPGTVTFKAIATSTASPLLFNAANVSGVFVYGITFDGNLLALASGSTALTQNVTQIYNVSNVIFDHVQWQNTRGIGLEASTSVVSSGVRDSCLSNVGMFWQTSGSNADQEQGIAFSSGSGNQSNFVTGTCFNLTGLDALSIANQAGFTATNNRFYQVGGRTSNGGACIYGNTDTDVHVTGNHCTQAYGNGIDFVTLSGLDISANSVEKAGGAGIQCSVCTQGTISGNKVVNSNQAGRTGTSNIIDAGLTIGGTNTYLSITGNTLTDNQGTPTQQYGFEWNSGVSTSCAHCSFDQSNIVAGNVVSAFGGGANYLPNSTVSGLSTYTCNAALALFEVWITDALSPTYNGTLTGGGAQTVKAICNGSAFVSH